MKEKLFERKLRESLRKVEKRREIIGIRGARQTGKTTLLKMISDGIPGDKAFINLDLADQRRSLEENPVDFARRYRTGKKLVLFLDEIQRVRDAGEKLKIIYDEFPEVKTFISGSSSLEIRTNILPLLVGRLFIYELMTFDFEEFLSTRDEGLSRLFRQKNRSLRDFLEGKVEISKPSFTSDFLRHWMDHVVFGGYPEVVKASDPEVKITILKNISSLYLEKDIMAFFRVEEVSNFENLVKSLAFNISNLLSVSTMSSDTGASYRRVEEFLDILQHTYIIHLLKPFHRNLTTELRKSPKAYFLDTGLRNAAIGNFSPFNSRSDRGSLAENFVLRELVSNFGEWKLNYWRTSGKAEIDFVMSKGRELVPIEVKLGGGKLGKGFHSFLNTYEPERALVATFDRFESKRVGRTTIHWVPAFYF